MVPYTSRVRVGQHYTVSACLRLVVWMPPGLHLHYKSACIHIVLPSENRNNDGQWPPLLMVNERTVNKARHVNASGSVYVVLC